VWSLDFLNDRKHFAKIGESASSVTNVGGGTPHGTVSGPNDFKLVINDLTFDNTYAKYVDDTTVLSVSGLLCYLLLFSFLIATLW